MLGQNFKSNNEKNIHLDYEFSLEDRLSAKNPISSQDNYYNVINSESSFDEITKLADDILKKYKENKNKEQKNQLKKEITDLDLELAVLRDNVIKDEHSQKALEILVQKLKNTSNTKLLESYLQRKSNNQNTYAFLENSWNILYNKLNLDNSKKTVQNTNHLTNNVEFDELGLLTKKCWSSYLSKLTKYEKDKQALTLTTGKPQTKDYYVAFFIDANGLHGINKDFGEEKGDEFISTVAESVRIQFDERRKQSKNSDIERRTKKGYRINDKTTRLAAHLESESEQIATRWGGDEFIMLLKGEELDVKKEASILPQKIIKYLEKNPIQVQGCYGIEDLIPSVGIGYAVRDNLEEAITDAEKACFVAKAASNHNSSLSVENKAKYDFKGKKLSLVDMYKALFTHIEDTTKEITTKVYELEKEIRKENILFDNKYETQINKIINNSKYERLNELISNTKANKEFLTGIKKTYITAKKDQRGNVLVDQNKRARIEGRPYIIEETFSKIYKNLNYSIENTRLTQKDAIKIINGTIASSFRDERIA